MGSERFYISDWHYAHKNILAFDNREFKTIEEMNEALVSRWNKVVKPGDIVYVLGDMFWCNMDVSIPVLQSLNGQKFLIKGNHDRCNDGRFTKQFVKVAEYLEVNDKGRKVVLCHYPIPCFKNHYYGWYHLYGHVHSSFEWNMMERDKFLMQELYGHPCNMYNVGAMMPYMNYTPRTLTEIISANTNTITNEAGVMNNKKPNCQTCEYRKTLARLTDCHVWGEDCPRYEMCGTQPQREVV